MPMAQAILRRMSRFAPLLVDLRGQVPPPGLTQLARPLWRVDRGAECDDRGIEDHHPWVLQPPGQGLAQVCCLGVGDLKPRKPEAKVRQRLGRMGGPLPFDQRRESAVEGQASIVRPAICQR